MENMFLNVNNLSTRKRELYNLLIGTPIDILPGELANRMREINEFFGPVTSGEISIGRAAFKQDAVLRWIKYLDRGEEDIRWPKTHQ